MIQTKIGHLQINVQPQNLAFYKDMFAFTGWQTLYEDPSMLGVASEGSQSLWFCAANAAENDYDGRGMNHLALTVSRQGDVDQMVEFLREKKVAPLFETPRHRPEFAADAESTCYQVMFESPDRILFEVVYFGKLEK